MIVRVLMCLLLTAGLLADARAARAEEPSPKARAFLEVRAEPATAVVGQQVRVTLRIGYDADFFAKHAVTLFRQALDLQAHVTAPWLSSLEDAVVIARESQDADGTYVRFVLDDAVTSLRENAPEPRLGLSFTVLTVERTLIAKRAGALTLAAPTLRYAYAPVVEENLLGVRTAENATPTLITGAATTIVVRDVPAEGRPAGFGGAVGSFRVEARAEAERVTVGESFELVLLISGNGNLGLIEQPRLGDLEGFHLYGAREEPSTDPVPARRVITYDVSLTRADVREVPAIPFVFYDPANGYQTVHTAPVRLTVNAAGAEHPGPREARTGVPSPDGPQDSGTPGREQTPAPTPFLLLAGLAALVMLALAVVVLVTKRPRRTLPAVVAAAPDRSAARTRTRDALLASLAGPKDGIMPACTAFLAEHLGCGEGAVIGPDLSARLHAGGVEAAVAGRTAAALEALLTARYGGTADAAAAGALDEELVRTLAAQLGPRS